MDKQTNTGHQYCTFAIPIPQFRPGGNDRKNCSKHFNDRKKNENIILLKTENYIEKNHVL